MFLSKIFGKNQLQNVHDSDNELPKKGFVTVDLRRVITFFYIFAALSSVGVIWYCGFTRTAAAVLLWALACSLLGAIFGFLFGIPKILQTPTPVSTGDEPRSVDYRQQVNTNLTEISDWLTKIIVGLGLINLNAIPIYLGNAADILAGSLNPADGALNKSFALALIVSYLILGFLYSYLSTRLFLQSAFSRADQEAATIYNIARTAVATITDKANATTEARISTLETKQEYILSTPAQSNIETREVAAAQTEEPLAVLRSLADRYLSIAAPTISERIRLKNKAATEMLNHIRTYNISKEVIFEEAERTANEGIILALANYILNYPAKGDIEYFQRIADRVSRLHVKYRIVQAIGDLFAKNCANAEDLGTADKILTAYEGGADPNLLSLIKGIRILINKMVNQENNNK